MSCAKFESDKATADTAYDNSLASASAGLAAANTAYFAAYQEFLSGGLATAPLDNRAAASKAFNIAVGQAGVTRAGAIGTAEVTEAGSLGTAESQWATATGTDETTLAGQLGPAADSLAATLASDDKTFVGSLTAAATTAAEGLATASQTFTTTSDSQIESTQELDAEMVTLAGADSTRAGALATTDGNFLTAQATADKDFQVATALHQLNAVNGTPDQFTIAGSSTVVSSPQAVYAIESADAQKILTVGRADADLSWFKSQATADSTFLQSDAASWQTDVTSDASAADTFAHTDDGAAQALNDSAASAEATVMTDQATADQTQANDDAAAETHFAQNEADQTMNSWNSLATSGMVGHTGDAWATFEYHKAQALDSWQTTADTNFKNYVSTLGSDEVTYAGTDSSKFLSEAQTIDAADQTDGDGTADADQTLVNTLAGDEVAYETVAATATASYQVAMAQAAHDYTVAVANAIDTYAHDNDNTKYTSALATASTNLSTAQQTAGTVYANGTTAANNADGLGAATATQETNDATALLTDATTVANDDLTDAQTADLQIDTYSKAESDAFDTQTKNDASALDGLIKGDADSLKTDAATADGSNASSWMNAWSSEVAADDTKEDTQADDAMNATDTAADALDGTEKGEADAQQQKSDADAQAVHDKAVNDAQAADTKSTTDANNITAAVAKDAYFATLPDAYPAFDWSTVPDPAVLDASYDEVYAVDDLALSLAAGQDDGGSPLPSGDIIGAMYITPAIGGASPLLPGEGQGEGSSSAVLGQSWSLGATTDPYGDIPGTVTPTGPGLLSDNGIYDPANPYAAGFTGWSGAQWMNVGQMLPGSGGSGSPGMPPPQTPGGGGSGGQQGQQVAQVPATKPMVKKDESNAGEAASARFAEGQGPVRIVGIVGRTETPLEGENQAGGNTFPVPPAPRSGLQERVTELEKEMTRRKGRGNPNASHQIYGSSDGKPYPFLGGFIPTDESATVADIAAAEVKQILEDAKNGKLDGDKVYRLMLMGHSWGADKAVAVANQIHKILPVAIQAAMEAATKAGHLDFVERLKGLQAKVRVYLGTFDSVNRKNGNEGGPGTLVPDPGAVTGWYNFFELDDPIKEVHGGTFPGADDDFDATTLDDPNDDQDKHLFFLNNGKVIERFRKDLGLPALK